MSPVVAPLAAAAREAYARRGIPPSEDKTVGRQEETQSLGCRIHGQGCVLEPPAAAARQLVDFALVTLASAQATQRWMQMLAGRWVRCMQFKRHTLTAVNLIWRCVWPEAAQQGGGSWAGQRASCSWR